MACVTTCLLASCIKSTACKPFQPGGWSKLWLANRCEITASTTGDCGGLTDNVVESITLAVGKLYTVDFAKGTGLLFDSVLAKNGDSWNWTHTVTIPLQNRACDTLAILETLLGAEITVFALNRAGQVFTAGLLGSEGFQVTAGNMTNGRLGTDAVLNDRTLTLVDSWRPYELIPASGTAEAYLDAIATCA